MTAKRKRAGSRPVFTSVAAHLFVADVEASSVFFTEQLGFAVDFMYGDPPFYGEITHDDARLALRRVDESVFMGNVREREQLLSASITVETLDEIERLFVSYQAAGVRFQQEIKTEPWGARTFVILDLDANLILFAGPAD